MQAPYQTDQARCAKESSLAHEGGEANEDALGVGSRHHRHRSDQTAYPSAASKDTPLSTQQAMSHFGRYASTTRSVAAGISIPMNDPLTR